MFRLALVLISVCLSTVVLAQPRTVAVYLPQAGFASNAEASAFARRLATLFSEVSHEGLEYQGRAFATRADLESFLARGRIAVLVADGVYLAGRHDTIVAHGVNAEGRIGPAPALYVPPSVPSLRALRAKTVALPDISAQAARFFTNTVFGGEVNPRRLFENLRRSKGARAGFGALRAGAVSAVFAPQGHPLAKGLKPLLLGPRFPMAMVALVSPGDASRDADVWADALVRRGPKGGGLAGWRRGSGVGLAAQRRALTSPLRVDVALPMLAPSGFGPVSPPRGELRRRGALPPPRVTAGGLYPRLPE